MESVGCAKRTPRTSGDTINATDLTIFVMPYLKDWWDLWCATLLIIKKMPFYLQRQTALRVVRPGPHMIDAQAHPFAICWTSWGALQQRPTRMASTESEVEHMCHKVALSKSKAFEGTRRRKMLEGMWVNTMVCMRPILSAKGEARIADMPESTFAPSS